MFQLLILTTLNSLPYEVDSEGLRNLPKIVLLGDRLGFELRQNGSRACVLILFFLLSLRYKHQAMTKQRDQCHQ